MHIIVNAFNFVVGVIEIGIPLILLFYMIWMVKDEILSFLRDRVR